MRKGRRKDDAVLYVHPRMTTGKLSYRDSSQKIRSPRRDPQKWPGLEEKERTIFAKKGIRREKGNYVKRNKGRICPLQDIGSQESPEEIIETPDSVLMGDSKNLKKHYQGWVLYRETVSHLGPKKKFQPTKNPKDELLECCPARGIPAENEQPWLT
ncbi:hypothetical protein F2Q68_00016788 [Brassica cretica]|uniref:Uncharacterized protein n=1 Tax=Brassica cretica TaxID=69181 RepID=A0A8S9HQ61_BRACR|nr:hypothetical protein F2Q68_00016788 [Brassica cretica]